MIPLKDNIPSRKFPLITALLITLNLLVSLWQLTLSDTHAPTLELARAGVSQRDAATIERGAIPFRLAHPGSHCGATAERIVCGEGELTAVDDSNLVRVPDDLESPAWWTTPFSSMFMHVDLLSVAINMLFLLIFGRTIEATVGRGRFALFYFVAGLIAIGIQTLLDPGGTGPIIGTSGALAAVLGAYAATYPRARVVGLVLVPLFATIVQVSAMILIGAWFILQLVPDIGQLVTPDTADSGLTYLAYAITFLLGAATARLLIRRPITLPPAAAAREQPVHG
ncbi:MAG: rhomboid family intramembrane serine protease [Solirubrobacterales bacterium]